MFNVSSTHRKLKDKKGNFSESKELWVISLSEQQKKNDVITWVEYTFFSCQIGDRLVFNVQWQK